MWSTDAEIENWNSKNKIDFWLPSRDFDGFLKAIMNDVLMNALEFYTPDRHIWIYRDRTKKRKMVRDLYVYTARDQRESDVFEMDLYEKLNSLYK